MSRKMCGTLLKVSATYSVGVAECSGGIDLLRSQTPYLSVAFWVKDLTMRRRKQLKNETCFQKKSSVSNMEEHLQQK